ncbi:Pre-B-cell leukemia transcription factor [Trichinella spiralis]|uniref:Pre-B-cell leukemia transcription factor n=1 Tax=Trichinella spiralis TaxID=6334 RepID=A0ABR3L1U8_TRISP
MKIVIVHFFVKNSNTCILKITFDENETNVRIYAKPPSGQGCEQSLEKAVWQGRDPDVVEVNLNSPLFLSVTRVRRSGRGLAF